MNIKKNILLAGAAILASVSVAHAQIILQDNFPGAAGPVNGTNWQANGQTAATQNGDGTASLNGGMSGVGVMIANTTTLPSFYTAPAVGQELTLTYAFTSITKQIEGGLFTTGGSFGIGIQNDVAGGDWTISLTTTAGGRQTFTTAVADATAGAWEIDWTQAGVNIDFNSASIFNTATSDITTGTGATTTAWVIPTAALAPGYVALGTGVDAVIGPVTYEAESLSVPEPSAIMLLGLGACVGLCYLKLKRLSSI